MWLSTCSLAARLPLPCSLKARSLLPLALPLLPLKRPCSLSMTERAIDNPKFGVYIMYIYIKRRRKREKEKKKKRKKEKKKQGKEQEKEQGKEQGKEQEKEQEKEKKRGEKKRKTLENIYSRNENVIPISNNNAFCQLASLLAFLLSSLLTSLLTYLVAKSLR